MGESCPPRLRPHTAVADVQPGPTELPPSVRGNHSRSAVITTIAFSAGVLAADSFASDDCTVMQVSKCARLPNGDVAGGAGDLGEIAQALSWLASGRKGDAPEIPGSGLLYTIDGICHIASTKFPGVRVKGNVAIGSGAQGAMVAMQLGKTAAEAVAAVIGVDPCTGGEIEVLPVQKPAPKRKRLK